MTRRGGRIRFLALAVTALLALLSMPGPVAADTCACDPIQPFLVVDRFDETHVVYRHSDNPGLIYASNKTGSWVTRRLTSNKDEPYAIAVDAAQKVTVVFRREVGDAVHFYLISNRSGTWVTSRLSTVQDDSYRIRIALDPAKHVHLAWETDEAAWYSTNATGTWARRRLDNAMGNNAQVAVDTAGNVHLVFSQCLNDGSGTCDGAGNYYQTNASGSWVTVQITDDQEDWAQDLLVDPAGNVHFVFVREYNSQAQPDLPLGVYYMTNTGGTWTTSRAAAPGRMANIERTPGGQILITFARVDGNVGIFLATLRNGVWTRSEVIKEYALYPTTGMESDGRLHIAFMRMAIDPGIYHAVWQNGSWTRRELMD